MAFMVEKGWRGVPIDADLFQSIMGRLKGRYGDRLAGYLIPPPIFEMMQGKFVEVEPEKGRLVARFPILRAYLNPYGIVQGGMLAAAVDNTLGPLSMLVAPPNVTRQLEVKFSRPARVELDYMQVTGHVVEIDPPWLHLRAEVRDPAGQLLAKAKASHWIVQHPLRIDQEPKEVCT
jgi:acyl-coenzyme A thioesterase PaaI-like protein